MDSIRNLLDLMEDLESNPEPGDILDFEFGDDVLVETRVVESRDGDLLLEMDMDALEYLGRKFTFEDAEWQGVAEDYTPGSQQSEYSLPPIERIIPWFTGELEKVTNLRSGFTNEIINKVDPYGRPGLRDEIRKMIINYINNHPDMESDNNWFEALKDLKADLEKGVAEGLLGMGSRKEQQTQRPYFTPNDTHSALNFLKEVHAVLEIAPRNRPSPFPEIHINFNFDPRALSDSQLTAVESAIDTIGAWSKYHKARFEEELMPKIDLEKKRRASFTGRDENSQKSLAEAEYQGRQFTFEDAKWQGVAEGSGETEETEETKVINKFEELAKQGRDPIDTIASIFGWGSHELDDLAKNLGFKGDKELGLSPSGQWANAARRGEGVNKGTLAEAEYRGRKVSLGKPFLTPDGPKKRSVYVKNPRGNVVKVNFGQKGVKIKKSNPARRKSFRARHGCDNPGPRHKAKFWSCRFW